MISLIQHFEADFLWKVSLKILNSGIILETLTHVLNTLNKGIPINMKRYSISVIFNCLLFLVVVDTCKFPV